MTPENFVFWLQGFVEISKEGPPDDMQWEIIQDHLKLVLTKETPNRVQLNRDNYPFKYWGYSGPIPTTKDGKLNLTC